MNIAEVESLLERSRPFSPPPEIRRRILEAATAKARPESVSNPRPRKVEVLTMAASVLSLLGTLSWMLSTSTPVQHPPIDAQGGGHPFEERRLTDRLPEGALSGFSWSADGRHWGGVVLSSHEDKAPCAVIVDGKREEPHFYVTGFCFGADGHHAYLAYDAEGGNTLVVDGIPQHEFPSYDSMAWSPDGKTLAFVAQNAGRWYVVQGGKRSEPFDGVKELTWSPDGRTLVFSAAISKDWCCVVNGKKAEAFDDVKELSFSPDGKTLAYCAAEGEWMLVVGGEKGSRYQPLGRPVFSRDGKAWAFAANIEGKEAIVVNRENRNKPGHREEEVGDTFDAVRELAMNAEGSRVAYVVDKGSRKYLVLGGKPTLKFSLIDRISFGPDDKTVAYRAGHYGKQFVIAGETRSQEFDDIVSGPVWSPDGKKIAFTARNGLELWSRVLDLP